MIVEIEDPRPSCGTSLDYNEGKVEGGCAFLVGYANLDAAGPEDIRAAFSRWENSAVYPVRQVSFHASVNPAEGDICTEDQVLSFITGLMRHLGYGSVPFVVYRHEDIERTHYHVVSVRVDGDGHKIPNGYEKRRATAYMRQVAHRYGFSMAEKGSVKSVESVRDDRPQGVRPVFDPGRAAPEQLRDIFRRALAYDFVGFPQLQCILEDCGVRAERVPTDSGSFITLTGLDRKGENATRVYSQQELGEDLDALFVRSQKGAPERHRRHHAEKERVRDLTKYIFGVSKSEAHLEAMMRKQDIVMHLSRSADTDAVFGITLVDHRTGSVFKASEIRGAISVDMMREALESGRWRAEDRGAERLTFVGRTRADAQEDSTALRNSRAGVTPRLLEPLSQPRGNSWSGRSPESEEDRRDKRDGMKYGAFNASLEDTRGGEYIE